MPKPKSPLPFFLLAFALSLPFWLIGARTELQLLPGLPVSALAAFCPAAAALILMRRSDGATGVRALLQRSFDHRRIRAKVWYLPILLLNPAVGLLSYALMRWLSWPLPVPQVPLLAALAMFVAFFVAALGEELGWSGYATELLQARFSALATGILMGLVWALVHYVPLLEAHRSVAWIAWWTLGTVSLRVLMVWLWNNTGKSIFGAVLFHATINLSWQLFPNYGSHWDPRLHGLIVAALAALAAVIWGPKRLTRAPL